jgi:hypothetical protein
VSDYDYHPLGGFSAWRCVCGVVVTAGNVCPQCKEAGDRDE